MCCCHYLFKFPFVHIYLPYITLIIILFPAYEMLKTLNHIQNGIPKIHSENYFVYNSPNIIFKLNTCLFPFAFFRAHHFFCHMSDICDAYEAMSIQL